MKRLLCVAPIFIDGKTDVTVGQIYTPDIGSESGYLITNDLGILQSVTLEHFDDVTSSTYSTFYNEFRGECHRLSEILVQGYPDELSLVRGTVLAHEQEEYHWWTVDKNGKIHDPSYQQFRGGVTSYILFDGFFTCEECGKKVKEVEVIRMGRYPVCSDSCARSLVGV